nr:terminase large subunit [Klebsiella pneumoniae]
MDRQPDTPGWFRFRTYGGGKPGDGDSPHCAIIDEYHEHDTDHMYEAMTMGMGARSQPLTLIITTAGSSLESPCYDKDKEVKEVYRRHNPYVIACLHDLRTGCWR